FRKDPTGKVLIKGLAQILSGGTQLVFTLPVGYRPQKVTRFVLASNKGAVFSQILIDGSVQAIYNQPNYAQLAANDWTDLSTIEFDTESVSNFVAGALPGPQRVATLPTNPYDGQECYFVADATNGILWHFRYNSSSVSPYKWECVGCSPLHDEVQAAQA